MIISCIETNPAVDNPNVCFKDPLLKTSKVQKRNATTYVSQSGNFCVVYKFVMQDGSNKAVRIWTKDIKDIEQILDNVNIVSSAIRNLNSQYFVQFDYYPDGILINGEWRPMVIMDWCEGDDLKKYISKNYQDTNAMKKLAKNFLDMVKYFHTQKISHGDLQHKNILVRDNGSIVVLDYDSVCVPNNEGQPETIKGLPGYQLFRVRKQNPKLSHKIDYYSELVIYVSIILIAHHSEVWTPAIAANDDILLLSDKDLTDINSSSSLLQRYKNDTEDDFMNLILTLQNWFNFGRSIDDFKPLEDVIEEPQEVCPPPPPQPKRCMFCQSELDNNSTICKACGKEQSMETLIDFLATTSEAVSKGGNKQPTSSQQTTGQSSEDVVKQITDNTKGKYHPTESQIPLKNNLEDII